MTECERIIEQAILPCSFFKEEIRCDFLVTEKRKKIWAIELDIFLRLLEVCKKYGLKVWACGGTLLGAIRHNGFIPWDDDMDFFMNREDYNKLSEVGPLEFKDPYFFQTPHTDKHYGYSFIKIRNSNSSCIPRVLCKAGFNHGIHIDVFPLDHVNIETYEEDKKRILECILKNSSYMKRNSIELLNERQLELFNKYMTDNPAKEYDLIHQIASNPSYKSSDYVTNATFVSTTSKNRFWKDSWYTKIILHDFETIKIPIPEMYHMELEALYGDYLHFPPLGERGSWHTDVIWDPDKPYTYYM